MSTATIRIVTCSQLFPNPFGGELKEFPEPILMWNNAFEKVTSKNNNIWLSLFGQLLVNK